MKRVLIFLMPIVFMVLLGCVAYVTAENNQNNGRVVGFVHGIVTDYTTNEVLENVEVTWMYKGKRQSTKTNNFGYYAISDLFPGRYQLTFTATSKDVDHVIRVMDIVIPDLAMIGIDDIPTGEDFQYSIIEDIEMYQKNAKDVKGTIYFNHLGAYSVARNVRVIADFSNYDIIPNKFVVTTGNDGKYTFSNLPTGPYNVSIYVEDNYSEANSNFTYSTSATYTINPSSTEITNVPDLVMTLNTTTVTANHNGSSYLPGNDISILFDKVINTTGFVIELIETGVDAQGNYYESTIALQSGSWQNFRTYRFRPTVNLKANTTYRLNVKGHVNYNNDYFTITDTFTTMNFPVNP